MRGFALGVLHWTPETFWAASMSELSDAIDGHNEAHGGKKSHPPGTRERLKDLLAEHSEPSGSIKGQVVTGDIVRAARRHMGL